MKLLWFIAMVPTVTCLVGAIYLMSLGKEGWGWLLVAALLLCPSLKAEDWKDGVHQGDGEKG